MYVLYRLRQLLGGAPALVALVMIVLGLENHALKVEPVYDESAVELALVEPEPEPVPEPVAVTPPPPEPVPVVEPEPIPEPLPVVEAEEAQVVTPPPPKPVPKPKVEPPKPKPEVKPAPKPVAKPVPVQPRPAEPQPVVTQTPTPPAPAAPPKVDSQALEGGYLKGLRADLDAYKQYPTGRQASLERPAGDVVVWLLVDRQGRVLDSGIQTQASSMLLNRAATNSLRRIKQVKPFPEQAFGGRDQHRFTATFNYSVQ